MPADAALTVAAADTLALEMTGIGKRFPGVVALIAEFTVAENIFLEEYPTGRTGSIDWKAIRRDAQALFDRIGFSVDTTAKTGRLPISQQQMVEIARALAHEARIVVMDEPT